MPNSLINDLKVAVIYFILMSNMHIAFSRKDSVFKLLEPLSYGPGPEKTCLLGFANNTGTDQPAHPRSLISAFVISFLESIIYKLATGEISYFLASLCSRGDWFETSFVQHPEDRLSHDKAHI